MGLPPLGPADHRHPEIEIEVESPPLGSSSQVLVTPPRPDLSAAEGSASDSTLRRPEPPASGTYPARPGPLVQESREQARFATALRELAVGAARFSPIPFVGYDPGAPLLLAQDAGLKIYTDAALSAASQLLAAAGVQHELRLAHDALLILPDLSTELGRLAARMARVGTSVYYSPVMLWNQRAVAHHALGALFVSHAAIERQTVAASEEHEALHAKATHLGHRLGEHFALDAWLLPIGTGTLFGEGADYTKGWSLEELATLPQDLIAEAEPLLVAERALAAGLPIEAADLRRGLEAIARYTTERRRGELPAKLAALVEAWSRALREGLPTQFAPAPSSYYVVSTAPPPFPMRRVLKAAHPSAESRLQLELTTHRLSFKDREVVDLLLIDHAAGAQLEVHLRDPGALATVQEALRWDVPWADPLQAVLRRFGPARLRQLAGIAEDQLTAQARLEAAAAQLTEQLERGARPVSELHQAVRAVVQALEALGAASRLIAPSAEPYDDPPVKR